MSSPPRRIILRVLERITAMSYGALFSVWALIITSFAAVYVFLALRHPEQAPSGLAGTEPFSLIGNSLYFSTVTATTVGYGDIVPLGFSKFPAALEATLGFFVFCLFISKLVSHRTDTALGEVHTLTFESKFHHAREGFFRIRKDFDAIIGEVERRGSLTEDARDTLEVACWEGQRLLESILYFYSGSSDLFTLDAARERLLLEAVHRTFTRLQRALKAFDAAKVRWRTGKTVDELTELLSTMRSVLRDWKAQSANPKGNARWFTQAMTAEAELRAMLEKKR